MAIESAPDWVKESVEEKQFLKGKLNCVECGAKVGSFDFVSSKSNCEDVDVNSRIHFVESKVDVLTADSKALSLLRYNQDAFRALTQNMSDRLAKFHASATSSTATPSCSVDDGTAFANEAFEMGRKKVSEVAASITRKGRECVANICASVDANISAHLPEFAAERRRQQTGQSSPVTSDDDTDDSVAAEICSHARRLSCQLTTIERQSEETLAQSDVHVIERPAVETETAVQEVVPH